jgi:hypothetical protein
VTREDDGLALFDIRLHVLPAGYRFDLRNRRPVIPERRTNEADSAPTGKTTKKKRANSAGGKP